jgi:hypothetical protein
LPPVRSASVVRLGKEGTLGKDVKKWRLSFLHKGQGSEDRLEKGHPGDDGGAPSGAEDCGGPRNGGPRPC